MTPVLPSSWLPPVPMKRIIFHWTAGTYIPSKNDRSHYHVLIDGNGDPVRGIPSIALNSGALHSGYAAHTLNCNTDSIGISVCSMGLAVESPFNPGPWPLKEIQWEALIRAIAQLAQVYLIPVGRTAILSHAEVQRTLNIPQRGKWDIARLAFDPTINDAIRIGDVLRNRVAELLKQDDEDAPEDLVDIYRVAGVGSHDTLTFRDGPNGDPKPGSRGLPDGTVVEKLSSSGRWWQVKTPAGYVGWVWSDYLEAVKGS